MESSTVVLPYSAVYCMAILFCSVLRRLVTLISSEATLTASKEAAIKQAKSASDMAKKLMEDNDKVNADL